MLTGLQTTQGFFLQMFEGAADLRGHLEHQQDLQALHVNAAIQQLHGLVQVVLSGQRNHQLHGEEKKIKMTFKSSKVKTVQSLL